MKPYKFIIVLAILICTLYSQIPSFGKTGNSDLDSLASWLSGSFSSQVQAQGDTNFVNVRLEMIPIWPDRRDGYWFYVEQALANYPQKPYRQRIYHVSRVNDSTFQSNIYLLNSPEQFIGFWEKGISLTNLSPDSLIFREGCSIFLKKTDTSTFQGKTIGKECISNLKGASYATAEVIVRPDMLISLDRGYNEFDKQVWGSKTEGYIFKKIKKYHIRF